MKIALIYDPESTHGAIWYKWLTEDGHQVIVFKDYSNAEEAELSDFGIVIPLISIRDCVHRPNSRVDALWRLEANDVPLLTGKASIEVSSDKLLTYQLWNKNAVRQPVTHIYDEIEYRWPKETKAVIVKPRFGHSGNTVCLVGTSTELHDAVKRIDGDALIQEYIRQPKCIRLIATDKRVLCAYEKKLDGSVIVNVEKGAVREYFEPSEGLIHFARTAIKALGGGLMGLDVLEKDGEYFALEANVPFGFDEHNNVLKTRLLHVINSYQTKRLL